MAIKDHPTVRAMPAKSPAKSPDDAHEMLKHQAVDKNKPPPSPPEQAQKQVFTDWAAI